MISFLKIIWCGNSELVKSDREISRRTGIFERNKIKTNIDDWKKNYRLYV